MMRKWYFVTTVHFPLIIVVCTNIETKISYIMTSLERGYEKCKIVSIKRNIDVRTTMAKCIVYYKIEVWACVSK